MVHFRHVSLPENWDLFYKKPHRVPPAKFQGWFQGLPIMGSPYGKLPILFPYHSHIFTDMGIVWVRGPIIVGPWKSHWTFSEVISIFFVQLFDVPPRAPTSHEMKRCLLVSPTKIRQKMPVFQMQQKIQAIYNEPRSPQKVVRESYPKSPNFQVLEL